MPCITYIKGQNSLCASDIFFPELYTFNFKHILFTLLLHFPFYKETLKVCAFGFVDPRRKRLSNIILNFPVSYKWTKR
jgi:hypothetical protein